MPLQKKLSTKGIDSDTAQEFLAEGFDRLRLNVRVMSSEGSERGAIETMNGNTIVTFSLPSGTNTCIGSKEDLLRKKIYYLVHNTTAANNTVLQYDGVTNTVTKVLQSASLNFSTSFLVTGINIIELDANNHLLYWTDFNGEPKKINIEKSIYFTAGNFTLGYKSPFDTRIVNRIKQPPLKCPTYTWDTPASVLQFSAYALAPQNITSGSTDIVEFDAVTYNPTAAFDTSTFTWTVGTTGVYNIHTITMLTGVDAGDPPNYDYTIYIKNGGVTLTSLHETEVLTGNFTFDYNNVFLTAGDLITIQVLNSTNLFGVPITAAVEGILFEASMTGLANSPTVNNSFKKLFQFKTQFVYDDFEVSSWSPISKYYFPDTLKDALKEDDIIFQDSIISLTVTTGSSIVKKIRIAAKEVNAADFALVAEIDKDIYQLSDNSTYVFTFLNDGNYVPLEINESIKLFDNVPLKSKSQEISYGNRMLDGLIVEGFDNVDIDMRLPITYGLVESSTTNDHYPKNSYVKSGGTYNYCIAYHDYPGNRSGTAQSTEGDASTVQLDGTYGTKLYIPFLTDSSYAPGAGTSLMDYVPIITAEIYNEAPSWPSHYQILRSKNLTISKYLQFAAKTVTYTGGTTDTIEIGIINIYTDYKTKYPNSTLVYDFTKGDRIRFIAPRASATAIGTPFAFNDVEIMSFDSATGILVIKDNFGAPSGMAAGVLFEIYTPASEFILDNDIIYEVCEEGDITYDSARGHYVHSGSTSSQIITSFTSATYGVPPTFNAVLPVGHGLLATNKVKIITSGYNVYGTVTSVTATSAVIATTNTLVGTFNGALSGTISTAAITELSSGDCFRRKQDNYYTSASLTIYVEASDVSNMFASKAWDYGRPNRIDFNNRQVTRPSTVRWSESFIPETKINGLSTVYDLSFQTYEAKYGGIYKLYAEDQRVYLYQELKIGGILVEQIIIDSGQGNSIIGVSSSVLSEKVDYLQGEIGIGRYPESFAVYNKAKYGIDVTRGIIWRQSLDGVIPISDLAFMHNFTTDICKLILGQSSKINIFGVYDVRFGEYIIAFSAFSGSLAQTLAFNEKTNLFSTFYSYAPENMCTNGIDIVSFKNGGIYTHNTNALQANFYGTQYQPEIWSVMNAEPSNEKILEAISEETNSAWEVYSITTPNGQASNLIVADFEEKNNLQYAAVLRDTNTPNITPPALPLFEGDVLIDTTFLAKFRYTLTSYTRMIALNYKYIISNLSNR